MKKITIIIFTISSILSFSQNMPNGIYFNVKKDIGFESEVFEFNSENKFNYFLLTCTGIGYGNGFYKLVQDSLHLKFVDHPDLNIQSELKLAESNSDSISINIKVIDYENGEVLPGASCYFLESKIGWATDFHGEVSAVTDKVNLTRTLSIDMVGFESYEIQIPPNVTSIEGTIKLGNLWVYDSTNEFKFKILTKRNNYIKLARYKHRNISYKKTKQHKISEIIKNRTGKSYEYFTRKSYD